MRPPCPVVRPSPHIPQSHPPRASRISLPSTLPRCVKCHPARGSTLFRCARGESFRSAARASRVRSPRNLACPAQRPRSPPPCPRQSQSLSLRHDSHSTAPPPHELSLRQAAAPSLRRFRRNVASPPCP